MCLCQGTIQETRVLALPLASQATGGGMSMMVVVKEPRSSLAFWSLSIRDEDVSVSDVYCVASWICRKIKIK